MRIQLFAIAATAFSISAPIGAQINCSGVALSKTEATICADTPLRLLDQSLNAAYRAANRVVEDHKKLKLEQQAWLKTVRDKCDDKDCLSREYEKRISSLTDLFSRSAKVSDKLFTDREVKETCSSLATLADQKLLASFSVPGIRRYWFNATSNPMISEEESARLKAGKDFLWNDNYDIVYVLRLDQKGKRARFASVYGGGSCASAQILNVDYFLENSNYGIEDLSAFDPDEEMRGVDWGGGEYPILYRGHNLLIASDLSDQNKIRMISWVKPDGRTRPLCLLKVQTHRIVTAAKEPDLCSGIVGGTIKPLERQPATKRLPLDQNTATYRDDFATRYGEYADDVGLLAIDINGDGVKKNIGRFDHPIGAGCGSEHIWLRVLSDDLGTVMQTPLNDQLRKLDGFLDIYLFKGNYYVDGTQSGVDGVVRIQGEKVEQVCEFGLKNNTTITNVFPLHTPVELSLPRN